MTPSTRFGRERYLEEPGGSFKFSRAFACGLAEVAVDSGFGGRRGAGLEDTFMRFLAEMRL
jgi:hypothetical protein